MLERAKNRLETNTHTHDKAIKLWKLKFDDSQLEHEYQQWRYVDAAPHMFIAISLSAAFWFGSGLIGWYWLSQWYDLNAGIGVAGVVIALALTSYQVLRQVAMQYSTLILCCIYLYTSITAVWIMLSYVAPVSGLAAALGILMSFIIAASFFGALCHLPPKPAIAATTLICGPVALYCLVAYGQQQLDLLVTSSVLSGCFFASTGAPLACAMIDQKGRRAFLAQRLIQQQNQKLDENNSLIQRYVPSAVAEQIVSGHADEITSPQRRRVTVLFSDIVGFTDIADRVEPEVMTEVLSSYMSSMAELIEAHQGTLNEFAGDGLMALFGAPETMLPEDQAIQAVQAAQTMQAELPKLNKQWRKLGLGAELKIRIGINTGMLSVGSYGSQGRMTYTAIGLQTNIASRIESAAKPGQILLSDASYQLLAETIACTTHGEVECKGVHYPIKVYSPNGNTKGPKVVALSESIQTS